MMKIRRIFAGLAVVAALGLAVMAVQGARIHIPQSAVQSAVNRAMPLKGDKVGVEWKVTSVQVVLRPDGRAGAEIDAGAEVRHRSISAHFGGNGHVLYRDGAFYLADFVPDKTQLSDPTLLEGDAEAVKRIGEGVLGRLGVPAGSVKSAVAETTERMRAGAEATASAAVGAVLANRPLYRLKDGDWRQRAARLVLRSVAVEDGVLMIDLAPPAIPMWGGAAALMLCAVLLVVL